MQNWDTFRNCILFLIALGVTYSPALFKDAQMNQANQEYIKLSEQNQPTDLTDPDAVLPDDATLPAEQDAILAPVADDTAAAEQGTTLPAPVTAPIDQPQDIPSDDMSAQPPVTNDTDSTVKTDSQTSPETNGAGLTSYKAQNKDFVVWLKVSGTKIDYPVVQSDNIDYYLTHTFEGTKSSLGTLFSLGNADYSGGRNIAIYRHHITGSGEKMFKPLLNYKDKSFWDDHQTITLDMKLDTSKLKKRILLYLPYALICLFATKLGQAWRYAPGVELGEKIRGIVTGLGLALQSPLPSFVPIDLYIGLVCGALVRL